MALLYHNWPFHFHKSTSSYSNKSQFHKKDAPHSLSSPSPPFHHHINATLPFPSLPFLLSKNSQIITIISSFFSLFPFLQILQFSWKTTFFTFTSFSLYSSRLFLSSRRTTKSQPLSESTPLSVFLNHDIKGILWILPFYSLVCKIRVLPLSKRPSFHKSSCSTVSPSCENWYFFQLTNFLHILAFTVSGRPQPSDFKYVSPYKYGLTEEDLANYPKEYKQMLGLSTMNQHEINQVHWLLLSLTPLQLKIQECIKKFQRDPLDTGSPEVQSISFLWFSIPSCHHDRACEQNDRAPLRPPTCISFSLCRSGWEHNSVKKAMQKMLSERSTFSSTLSWLL